jgi:4-amino-4-deoxy-L-arabinose transferase-like glycosyltransferase
MHEPSTVTSEARALTPSSAQVRAGWAVLVIAAIGWLLRGFPLIQAGAFGYPVDYDEGVYFASSAMLLRGVLPYRDFVFAHPPGLLYFLSPVAWLGTVRDPAFGFAAARWLVTLVGCANILLLGRLAMRWAGPLAAIIAAAVYATHPQAVPIERGPFLEPVLNLCCLALASVWLDGKREDRLGWRALVSGALCGLAASVKLVGVVWLLACLVSRPRQRSLADWIGFAAAGAAVWFALAAPLALTAPASFFTQVVSFHAHRPPDGPFGPAARLGAVFWQHGLILESSLIVCGLAFALGRGRDPSRRAERFFACAFIVIVTSFLASPSYWSQYNAHLALPESALAGYGAANLWRWASRPAAKFRWVPVSALLIAVLAWGARRAILTGHRRSPELIALAGFVRTGVPSSATLFAFDPSWTIAVGRLPGDGPEASRVVDSYATMLLDASRSGRHFAGAVEAFGDSASQFSVRRVLAQSRFVIVGARGHGQMSPETLTWFQSRFVQRFPPPGAEGIDVWERAP